MIEQVERLSAELEDLQDPKARELAESLVAAVLEMHGEGLARVFAELDDDTRDRLARDSVVGSLMLLHGLYPESLETRVEQALEEVRPYMESHGGGVELLGVDDELVVHLRLEGSCDGCAASSSTLELAVEKALREHCPDLAGMAVEGTPEPEPTGVTGRALPMVEWQTLEGADDLATGTMRRLEVGGRALVVANAEGSVLAYVDECASCGAPISAGSLSDGVLACASCKRRFFLPRAGRSLDDEKLMLAPIPLLAERGGPTRVAV